MKPAKGEEGASSPVPRYREVSHAACRAVAAVILGVLLCGCNTRPYMTADRLDKGLVVILPGMEMHPAHSALIREGLMEGGVSYAFEIYNWYNGNISAKYVYDEAASRMRARELADHIFYYQITHPERPVFLIGHSGGGAIAVFATEVAARRRPIDGLIVLAPLLGPEYDLTTALNGSNGRMVNCWSSTDFLLRAFTTAAQNFDGSSGETAGQGGFRLPPGAPASREKAFASLVQIKWAPDMLKEGNWGGHLAWSDPYWVKAELAPIIEQWSVEAHAAGETHAVAANR
jgi:pimeloyl-ACP methyl ester carboxylesterase